MFGYPVPDDKSEVCPTHIAVGEAVTGVGLKGGITLTSALLELAVPQGEL